MTDSTVTPTPLAMVVAIKAQSTGNYFIANQPHTRWTDLLSHATTFTTHDALATAIRENRLDNTNIALVLLMRVGDQWLPVVGTA